MVNKVEAEMTALQADFAHTITWLRGDYLPSPLPKVVEDRLADLTARLDVLRDMVEEREATAAFTGRTRSGFGGSTGGCRFAPSRHGPARAHPC